MSQNTKWHILYCDKLSQVCPITDFIESQPDKHQVKILRFLELLQEMGPSLTRPYADLLRDGIHELRMTLSGDHVRLLYFFCFQQFIILYEAFFKHTDKVPDKYIRQTLEYRDTFLERITPKDLENIIHADA
jgi:hypothetical protein